VEDTAPEATRRYFELLRRAQGGALDLAFMQRWAGALAITELLARATVEAARDSG